MCSDGVANAFRKAYPFLGAFTTLLCLYILSMFPPLHVELYSTSVRPINGTIQIIQCVQVTLPGVANHCKRVVDQPARLQVDVYHSAMGIPFLAVCIIGAVFCSLTRKERDMVFNMNIMFTPDTYAPLHGGGDESSSSSSLYTWELVFWSYVLLLHVVLVVCLTSPVDVFDATVAILFGLLCFMFLCRPRGNTNVSHGGTLQGIVLATLLVCVWLTFTSIPHVYQQDRLWLMAVLTSLDGLLLLIHMYDNMPTMYTIVMGRLTYVTLGNVVLSYAFATLEDRLSEYVHSVH